MRYIFCVFFVIFFVSCGQKQPIKQPPLAQLLIPIATSEKEAFEIAKDAFEFSATLKKKYDLIPYPNFNNFLVNIGVKKRGLCWQLAFDFLKHLKSKKYNVDYYIAGANINKYFTEHNVIVLTCKGCSIKKGILLDPWRNGGDLYYAPFMKDEKFKWKQRGGLR